MSRPTRLTTTRFRNRLRRPCAINPSTPRLASAARPASRRLARRRRRLFLALRIEDRLDSLLLAALHDAAVLREVDRDALARDDVVLLPHPGVADQEHALLGVVVLRALRGADLAVLGDDLHVPGGHRTHDPVAL